VAYRFLLSLLALLQPQFWVFNMCQSCEIKLTQAQAVARKKLLEDITLCPAVSDYWAQILSSLPKSARYSEHDGQLAYTKHTERGNKDMRAKLFKLLLRWLPEDLPQKNFDALCDFLRENHPKKGASEPVKYKLIKGLQGNYIAATYNERTGSCMEDTSEHCTFGKWENLNDLIDENTVSTLIVSNAEKYTENANCKHLRAFFWSCEDAQDNQVYLLDRFYPSTPKARDLAGIIAAELQEKTGKKVISYDSLTGSGCRNSEELPPLRFQLSGSLDFSEEYPWLDSLTANFDYGEDGSNKYLYTPAHADSKKEVVTNETCGHWLGGTICEHCGESCGEDYSVHEGETYCEYCFNDNFIFCEECNDYERIDNAINANGTWFCSASCARANGNIQCDECDMWVVAEECINSADGEVFCDCDCIEVQHASCIECGEYHYQADMQETQYGDSVCPDCSAEYTTCDCCGDLVKEDDIHGIHGADYCTQCIESIEGKNQRIKDLQQIIRTEKIERQQEHNKHIEKELQLSDNLTKALRRVHELEQALQSIQYNLKGAGGINE